MMKSKRRAGAIWVIMIAAALLIVPSAWGQVSVKKPVKLQIIDVAGNLTLSKAPIEAFKAKHPDLVAEIEYVKLTAPELPAKLKAQQMAGVMDTTLVLTGTDGMASGIEQDVYLPVTPTYLKDFQKYIDN